MSTIYVISRVYWDTTTIVAARSTRAAAEKLQTELDEAEKKLKSEARGWHDVTEVELK